MRNDVRVTYLQDTGERPVLWAATRVSDRRVLALSRPYTPEEQSLASLDRTLLATSAAATVVVSLTGLLLGLRMGRRAVAGLEGVELQVIADAVVRTDPRRVERILTNLATNALRHGAPPVEMQVDGPVVRIRDHGPGYPADLLAVLHTSGPNDSARAP
ncbi:ATP-binding protein [Streptomyces sp. HD]|nr:ATP-binding protein [Streptomyces sp. HD]MDC0773204.1 ATP-binding protein [Streptomyces sp. HD]